MINILLKDFFLEKKNCLFVLAYTFITTFIFKNSSMFYIAFTSILLFIINPYYYTSKNKGYMITNSLPINYKEVIFSHYIKTIIYILISFIFHSISVFLINLIIPKYTLNFLTFNQLLYIFVFSFISCTILFPICYLFSYDTSIKIIYSFILFIILKVNIHTYSVYSINYLAMFSSFIKNLNIYVSLSITLFAYICSMLLSLKIYKNKDFY